MRLSKNKLELLKQYFTSQPAIVKVYLFGSFARGEATAKSDIDLLVALNYDYLPMGIEFFQIWNEIEALVKRKVDFVTETSLSKRVQPFVEPEKILIYEKKARKAVDSKQINGFLCLSNGKICHRTVGRRLKT